MVRSPKEIKVSALEKKAPVAQSKTIRTQKPKITTRENGDARITHKEYIADIKAGLGTPTAFNLTQYAINPGQATTFPWLSKIASNYESYIFEKLTFSYQTEAPSSLGGTMVMTVDYDASDAAPTNKQQALTYRSAVRSAPWVNCDHYSLTEDLRKSKTNFVRPGLQPGNTDIKTYDVGNLFVISQGVTTASAVLGELYVEYTVNLMTPVYENPVADLIGGGIVGGGVATVANPLGTIPVLNANAVGIEINAASRITFVYPGQYTVTAFIGGTGLTNSTATPSGGTIAISEDVEYVDPAGTFLSVIWSVLVTAANAYFTLTLTGTTVVTSQVAIGQVPINSTP